METITAAVSLVALSCPGAVVVAVVVLLMRGGGDGGERDKDRLPNICFHAWKDSKNGLTSKTLNQIIITPLLLIY